MDEGGRLEIYCSLRYRGFESHPLLSSSSSRPCLTCRRALGLCGEVTEWTKVHDWKSCVQQCTVGSNPTLSAIEQSPARLRRRVSWNCHRERTRWDSNEGDRGGDTPLRGETRGGGPPQWERVSATSNAHPLRHQRLLDHRLANRGDGIDVVTVTGPGPVQQNPVNPARSGRKQR